LCHQWCALMSVMSCPVARLCGQQGTAAPGPRPGWPGLWGPLLSFWINLLPSAARRCQQRRLVRCSQMVSSARHRSDRPCHLLLSRPPPPALVSLPLSPASIAAHRMTSLAPDSHSSPPPCTRPAPSPGRPSPSSRPPPAAASRPHRFVPRSPPLAPTATHLVSPTS
jgi:hypothetical protein